MCDCNRLSSVRAGIAHAMAREGALTKPTREHDLIVRYVGANAMLLKGPTSRRVYAVKPGMDPLPIDERDAKAFLGSPLFVSS